MKILESTREPQINSDFGNSMFGIPKFYNKNRFEDIMGAQEHARRISMPISAEDISKLDVCEDYKDEIAQLTSLSDDSTIWKDVNGGYWLHVGLKGCGMWWSVNGLGSLESGKYCS